MLCEKKLGRMKEEEGRSQRVEYISENGSQDHDMDDFEAGEKSTKWWVPSFSEGERRDHCPQYLVPHSQHRGVRCLLIDVRPAVRMR